MYERFTDRARKVMSLANAAASAMGQSHVGTEHLLLGLLKEGSGVAAAVLKNLDVDMEKLQQELHIPFSFGVVPTKLPLRINVQNVLAYAKEEAGKLGHNYIGTEHLLLGLIREPSFASHTLQKMNVKLEDVRRDTIDLLCPPKAEPQPATAQSLYDDYQVKLKKLQDTCLHTESLWCMEFLIPGHQLGNEVQVCKCCHKILNKREWNFTIQVKE